MNWSRTVVALLVLMAFAALVIFSFGPDRRPTLLRDAEWNEPASAIQFQRRFGSGTPEVQLLQWLERNNFHIDHLEHEAFKRVSSGLACNELIEIGWIRDPQGRLIDSYAQVSEAGCL